MDVFYALSDQVSAGIAAKGAQGKRFRAIDLQNSCIFPAAPEADWPGGKSMKRWISAKYFPWRTYLPDEHRARRNVHPRYVAEHRRTRIHPAYRDLFMHHCAELFFWTALLPCPHFFTPRRARLQ